MKIYELIEGIWTGQSQEVSPFDGRPANWARTDIEPPELVGEQVAQWTGESWVVLAERPDLQPAPTPVPQSVTPAQGLMALYVLKGITEDDVLAAIGTIEDATLRYQAQIAYKKATVWDRVSVTMQTVAALMALTEHDLDELFTLAATYTNL